MWNTYLYCLAAVVDAGVGVVYLEGDVEGAEVYDAAGKGRHVLLLLLGGHWEADNATWSMMGTCSVVLWCWRRRRQALSMQP